MKGCGPGASLLLSIILLFRGLCQERRHFQLLLSNGPSLQSLESNYVRILIRSLLYEVIIAKVN